MCWSSQVYEAAVYRLAYADGKNSFPRSRTDSTNEVGDKQSHVTGFSVPRMVQREDKVPNQYWVGRPLVPKVL